MSSKIPDPEGAAKHARKSLAHAVVALGSRNMDADNLAAACRAWQGLVAGRWSLVEHVDTDGKRFLVARKNDSIKLKPNAVSLRERRILALRARGLSLKVIADELGLSVVSISKSIACGMAKLGLSCEAELVAIFSSATAAPAAVPETKIGSL